MRLQHPLNAISSAVGAAALTVLARADAQYTAPRIQALLPEPASLPGLRKALARLVAQGIVSETIVGNTRAYRLNREHILAGPLIEMTRPWELVRTRMRQHIDSWAVRPLAVRVFGSAARGDMTDDSDIDLLIVLPDEPPVDRSDNDLDRLASDLTAWTGNDTRPLVYSKAEVRPSPIFDSILAEGLDIAGDPHWLRRHLYQRKQAS